jgi:putative SOS response-associated peptidase YedK
MKRVRIDYTIYSPDYDPDIGECWDYRTLRGGRKKAQELGVGSLVVRNFNRNRPVDWWQPTFAILTGEPNELMAPIHDRMTTFVEPRDDDEYLAPSERPPIHLLRILSSEKMKATLVGETAITNHQVGLFDSQ